MLAKYTGALYVNHTTSGVVVQHYTSQVLASHKLILDTYSMLIASLLSTNTRGRASVILKIIDNSLGLIGRVLPTSLPTSIRRKILLKAEQSWKAAYISKFFSAHAKNLMDSGANACKHQMLPAKCKYQQLYKFSGHNRVPQGMMNSVLLFSIQALLGHNEVSGLYPSCTEGCRRALRFTCAAFAV